MELSLKNPECTKILVYSNHSHTTSTIATVGEDELPWTNAWSFWGTCRWELNYFTVEFISIGQFNGTGK